MTESKEIKIGQVDMSDVSKTVFDCDTTVEAISLKVDESTQTMLQLADESWYGDSQIAFLESYYKWVEDSKAFIDGINSLSDCLINNVEKVESLLKKGQSLHF
ncbi:hypothetical protein HBE96_12845 [Clostridium sp. P21]|uniref:Uncharacterized protein n=1 Tax=Clostridium muellerianum TaxID=2716538 RepID=A0A7Y0EHL4_9CLOT|nr:hypothetical protein [Clostridium muellerianum]NMM63546.1 hypothetical protein [Clostridium muellerianum]